MPNVEEKGSCGMRFYEFENEWSEFKGVWCSKEQSGDKDQRIPWDASLEVEEMDLYVSGDCIGDDDFEFSYEVYGDNEDFEVSYEVYGDNEDSWSLPVTIPDGEKFGTPECCTWKVYYTPTMEFMGWVHVDDIGNKTENILLGLYDLIEAHCQGKKIFGITC